MLEGAAARERGVRGSFLKVLYIYTSMLSLYSGMLISAAIPMLEGAAARERGERGIYLWIDREIQMYIYMGIYIYV
jgi:hypothetical protein